MWCLGHPVGFVTPTKIPVAFLEACQGVQTTSTTPKYCASQKRWQSMPLPRGLATYLFVEKVCAGGLEVDAPEKENSKTWRSVENTKKIHAHTHFFRRMIVIQVPPLYIPSSRCLPSCRLFSSSLGPSFLLHCSTSLSLSCSPCVAWVTDPGERQ